MFLENESELCECKVNVFSADKVMTTCLVLHTDYHILWEFSFRQLSTLQSILLGVFPWERKKQTKEKTNAESMDRSWKFQDIVSQKLEGTWLFMWLHYLGMFT